MKQIYGIFIEADPSNSLGGSCIRDLYNMSNHIYNLNKSKYNSNNLYIYSNNNLSHFKDKFPQKNISFFIIDNILLQVTEIIKLIPKNSTLIIFISGHGYQMIDKSGDEIDNLDEYVRVNNGILLDDQIKLEIIDKIDNTIEVIAICDTCHSGSMFDLDYKWSNNQWIRDTNRKLLNKNVISIGACQDNQMENCDIGNIGYGGALTVHLIDNNYIELLLENICNFNIIYNNLCKILRDFNQIPVIQTSSKYLLNLIF